MLQDLGVSHVTEELSVNAHWLSQMKRDFERRFSTLLGFSFREVDMQTCLDVLDARLTTQQVSDENAIEAEV